MDRLKVRHGLLWPSEKFNSFGIGLIWQYVLHIWFLRKSLYSYMVRKGFA